MLSAEPSLGHDVIGDRCDVIIGDGCDVIGDRCDDVGDICDVNGGDKYDTSDGDFVCSRVCCDGIAVVKTS